MNKRYKFCIQNAQSWALLNKHGLLLMWLLIDRLTRERSRVCVNDT